MSAENLIASFLHIAREDLAAARLLASANNRNAIYLAEQAAEKIIRAVLASERIPGRISHQHCDAIRNVSVIRRDGHRVEDHAQALFGGQLIPVIHDLAAQSPVAVVGLSQD